MAEPKLTPYNGLLLLHKPGGITSHDLVDQVRRVFGTREVGHSGTLDPMASGLMVVLLNQATKLSPYVMDGNKAYTVEVLLGSKTDTLDVTGQILETREVTDQMIAQIPGAIQKLQGDFEWPVPKFSAVKVEGKKLYDLARSQVEFEAPKKQMSFWGCQLHNSTEVIKRSESGLSFWVDIKCGKGNFVRTWVDQLGESLGCGATMKGLIRTESQPYHLSQAKTLDETKSLLAAGEALPNFVPMNWALPHLKKARVQTFDQTLLMNGQISHDLRRLMIGLVNPQESSLIQAVSAKGERLLAVIAFESGQGFKIRRVFADKN